MHDPKWCLFFDFHTMPANPDVGHGFNAEVVADRIASCGVDTVVFPARCNLGTAYYQTKIGIVHPSMAGNLLPDLVRACHARDIAVTAYINTGLSHEEGLRRREWLILPEDGRTYQEDRLNNFFRQMCYYSEYGDHVTAMAREVVEMCDVDGLFLDCMHTNPCIGYECMQRMKSEGIDWRDPCQLQAFNCRKIIGLGRRIATAAREVKADLMLYFNGIDYESQAEFGTYLEFECLPTGGWGYELLPVGARYLRTLGKPTLNMTGRFHRSWGDFGGIRTEASLEYDCLYGLANGLRSSIGDHFHPRGDINEAVMALDKRIYRRLQRLEPWLEGARPVVEAALPLLKPYPGYRFMAPDDRAAYAREFDAVKAGTRVLAELKMQFDVPSLASDWGQYDLLVLPDFVRFDAELTRRVRAHLDKGGAILSSGWSGLEADADRVAFPEWGVEYLGNDPFDPAFVRFDGEFAAGQPDMPVTLYDRGTCISAGAGTEVLATIVAPYYNHHWDGEHGFVYMPPDRDTGRPAVTLRGNVAHVSHPVFTSYYGSAPVPMRTLVENLLRRLLPCPLVRVPAAPSFSRVTITSQEGRRMVHILSYVPELRGAATCMIEEPIELRDQVVLLRLDGRIPGRVYLAPDGTDLPFVVVDGYIRTVVPSVPGYALVVFED